MFLGIVIAIAIDALLFFVASSVRNKTISTVGWLVLAALLVILSVENIKMVSAIEKRTMIKSYTENVQSCIKTSLSGVDSNHILTVDEARVATIALKTTMPMLSRNIKISDMLGKELPVAIASVQNAMLKAANKHIWILLVWIVVTIAVGVSIVILSMDSRKGRSRAVSLHGRAPRNAHRTRRR